jgi:hypothetical protein
VDGRCAAMRGESPELRQIGRADQPATGRAAPALCLRRHRPPDARLSLFVIFCTGKDKHPSDRRHLPTPNVRNGDQASPASVRGMGRAAPYRLRVAPCTGAKRAVGLSGAASTRLRTPTPAPLSRLSGSGSGSDLARQRHRLAGRSPVLLRGGPRSGGRQPPFRGVFPRFS